MQVNITWLTHLTSAVTVGLVGGVKIAPQWAFALLFEHKLDVSASNLLGVFLMVVAGTLFTYGRAQRAPRIRAQHAMAGVLGTAGLGGVLGERRGSRDGASAERATGGPPLASSVKKGAT